MIEGTPGDALRPFLRCRIEKFGATYRPTYKEIEYIIAGLLVLFTTEKKHLYLEDMMGYLPTWSRAEIVKVSEDLKDVVIKGR